MTHKHPLQKFKSPVPSRTRKKPLRKLGVADVRWSRWDNTRVVAAPKWAYEMWHGTFSRAQSAWANIYALRKRRIREKEKRFADAKAEDIRTLADPKAEKSAKEVASIRMRARSMIPALRPKRGGGPPWAPYGTYSELRTCRVCESEFYGQGRISACSDACAKKRRDATRTRGNPKPRRVLHQPRPCRQCLAEFTPRRKDAVFCSGKCRTAAHREVKS